MEKAEVARWLADYVAAWRTWEREPIVALFADAASYRWHPYDEPVIGSQAIADAWLGDPEEPGGFDAAYQPIAVDGDTAVATGSTTYSRPDGSIRAIYDNCFVMRFDDDGRCREFVEWFIERPAAPA
jgi:hypothetical protein